MPVLPQIINTAVKYISKVGSPSGVTQNTKTPETKKDNLVFNPGPLDASANGINPSEVKVVPVAEIDSTDIHDQDETTPEQTQGALSRFSSWLSEKATNAYESVASYGKEVYTGVVNLAKSLKTVSNVTKELEEEAVTLEKAIESGDADKIAQAEANFNAKTVSTIQKLRETNDPLAIAFADRLAVAQTPGEIIGILNEIEQAKTELAEGNYNRLVYIAVAREEVVVVTLQVQAEQAAKTGDTEELTRIAGQMQEHENAMAKIEEMAPIISAGNENSIAADISQQINATNVEAGKVAEILITSDDQLNYLGQAQRTRLSSLIVASVLSNTAPVEIEVAEQDGSYNSDYIKLAYYEEILSSIDMVATLIEDSRTSEQVREILEQARQEVVAIEEKAITRRIQEKKDDVEIRAARLKEKAEIVRLKLTSVKFDNKTIGQKLLAEYDAQRAETKAFYQQNS